MKYAKLGTSELTVSRIGLGTMGFGWQCDERESHAILDCFFDHGGNLIDTANCYSRGITDGPAHWRGQSEQIIGSWIKTKKRDEVIIASKVGSTMEGDSYPGLSRRSIRHHIDESLRRLKTDYIDLYQAHCFDKHVPISETLHTFEELVNEGKIRYYGCSNYSPDALKKAYKIAQQNDLKGYVSAQDSYNLIIREFMDHGIHAVAKKLDVGVIAYKPLAAGFLTGKYRPGKPVPESYNSSVIQRRCYNEHCWEILRCLDSLADQYRVTVVQIVLAWYCNHPVISSVLAGTRSYAQIAEITDHTDLTISSEDYDLIDRISSVVTA